MNLAPLSLLALLVACSGGGGGGGIPVARDVDPQLIACRARVDQPHRFAEIALRDVRNLGIYRVVDRNGPELRARLHPDGKRVVFARERFPDDPASRELFLSTIDNSAAERRLTLDTVRDDAPVFSPDGARILFASEREGTAGLWLIDVDGSNPERLLPPPTGFADGEPDWHRGTDRVVFSRRDLDGHHTLWLVNGSGFGVTPLTDGGATVGEDTGDRDPAFSPDGATVAFVRRSSDEQASLCLVETASGVVSTLLAPDGDVGLPRFAPTADRLFFGLAEPNAGRQTLRLAQLPLAGGDPVLVWPDERWALRGVDFLPTAPPAPVADAPLLLDVQRAAIEVTFAADSFGAALQLTADDDNELYLRTAASGERNVAGITCTFALPVDAAEDLLELRVRALARATRVDGDSLFRISVFNPSDSRFDTAVEWTPTDTGQQELAFRTTSLRHVNRDLEFRMTVIADLSEGDPADLWIDLVEVTIVPRRQD